MIGLRCRVDAASVEPSRSAAGLALGLTVLLAGPFGEINDLIGVHLGLAGARRRRGRRGHVNAFDHGQHHFTDVATVRFTGSIQP